MMYFLDEKAGWLFVRFTCLLIYKDEYFIDDK